MDTLNYGTLYDTLQRTVARWGERPAYSAPAMAGRAYHPKGKEYTGNETATAVESLRQIYREAGYGLGHRVAILFEQRPEFVFHYYALKHLAAVSSRSIRITATTKFNTLSSIPRREVGWKKRSATDRII